MKNVLVLSALLLAGCTLSIGPYHRNDRPGVGLPGPPGPPLRPGEQPPPPSTNNVYTVTCPVCMATYTMHPTSDIISGGVNLGVTNSMQVSEQFHSLTFTCLMGHSFNSGSKTMAYAPIAYPIGQMPMK